VGLGQRDLDAAAEGEIDALPHDLGRVVAWTTAVVEAKGEMPLEWPAAARDMTMLEREQVLALARLVLVLKSIVPPPFG
jgi:hypothetical protein